MSITVHIEGGLRQYCEGRNTVSVEGKTVAEALNALSTHFSDLMNRILDPQGRKNRFIPIFVNDEDIRALQDLDTPLKDGDEVTIFPPVGGGSEDTEKVAGFHRPGPGSSEFTYLCMRGEAISLVNLSDAERAMVKMLQERVRSHSDWNNFENFWMQAVADLYRNRQLTPRELQQTPVYRIAQDLGGRFAIVTGRARRPDYRDELAEIIRTHFPTRRAFCEATGGILTETMLSQVLSRQKHMSIDLLTQVVERVGYELRLMPRADDLLSEPIRGGPENEQPS